MTAFLFVVAVLVAIWVARNESRVAELTSRLYSLEQEFKKFRTAVIEPPPLPPPVMVQHPAPVPVVERIEHVPPPAPELANLAAQTRVSPPRFEEPRRRFSFRDLLNVEETLGTNWLNKLGIVILVIGVALFLAYEVRELGPAGKVLVGYLVCGAMLGAGIFFERRKQWRVLARAGIAGGWSLLYFTTYAMYHVPAARVLSSESLDLALLLLVAAGMVAHTLRYASQVVTGLAFLLAFTTINLSRGNASSLIASAILAAALAGIAVRRRWFEMEIAGMVAAYVNHYLWLRPLIEPMHGHVHVFPGYVASAALLYGYWLIFRGSYILRSVPDRRGEIVSTIAAVLNVGLFGWVMGYQFVHPELAFQFLLVVGVVEFTLGQLPLTRRRRAAFIVLTTLGCCFLVAAFPFRYSEETLSASWLAIAECLLLAGVFLREIVFRRLGLLVALAAWIQMVGKDAAWVLGERTYGINRAGQPGLALLFAVAALTFYVDSQYIPRRWPEAIRDQLDRLCFSRLAHIAGTLGLIGAWIAWPGVWTAVAWASLAVALAYSARRWDARELVEHGAICASAAVLRVLFVNLYGKAAVFSLYWLSERLLTMALVVALLYISTRWTHAFWMVDAKRVSAGYTWAAAVLMGLLAWYELQAVAVALGWSLAAVMLLEIGLKRGSTDLRLQAYAGFAASFLRIFVLNLNAVGNAKGYATVPLALAFYYVYARLTTDSNDSLRVERKLRIAEAHCFFGTLALAALLRFELDADLIVVGWAALILLLLAIAWKTGRRIFLDQGILIGFGLLLRGIFHNLYERSYFPAPFGHGRATTLGTAIVLLFVALPFARALRLPKAESESRRWFATVCHALDRRPDQVFFFIPFVLLTMLLALEMPSGMVTLAWGVEAFAVFALAIWVKERSYRLSALGLLLLCIAKIVVRDVWRLAPRDRYLTFIVLGSALLGVSYLYTRYREVLRQYL